MFLDIKPVHDGMRNCLEDIYATVALNFKLEYIYMFANSWSFYYNYLATDQTHTIGSRISLNRDGDWKISNQDELLHYYHGIKLDWHDTITPEDVLVIIKNELLVGLPTCIFTDSYWCAWHPSYQKDHIEHYCLVIGIDNSKNILYCIDPYTTNNVVMLPIEDYLHVPSRCMTFSLVDIKLHNVNWKEIVINAVTKVFEGNSQISDFDAMKRLADELTDKLDINVEVQGYYEAWAAPIFRRVEHISWGRRNFSKLLKYIGVIYNMEELITIAKELNNAGKEWSIIRGMLIKTYMSSNKMKIISQIETKLKFLADYEERIAKMLYSLDIK